MTRNDRYGIQRMEMLAIYPALADSRPEIQRRISAETGGTKNLRHSANFRNDSKTCVNQLQEVSKIRDASIQRICNAISAYCKSSRSLCALTTLAVDMTSPVAYLSRGKEAKREKASYAPVPTALIFEQTGRIPHRAV